MASGSVTTKLFLVAKGTAPKNNNPWMVLRFNTVDGEAYGRGRVGAVPRRHQEVT